MNLAIMQPYVVPYQGYFQLMVAADPFVVYDDAASETRCAPPRRWWAKPLRKLEQAFFKDDGQSRIESTHVVAGSPST